VQTYSGKQGGQALHVESRESGKPSLIHWVVVVPVMEVNIQVLQERCNDLAKQIIAEDSSLDGGRYISLDATVAETKEGSFGLTSGPALSQTLRYEGSRGMLFITAKAMVRQGSGYYPILSRSAAPTGKKVLFFDVLILKWE
jgi:hypothetical protein